MTGAFAVFGESTFEMLNCYFIFINYLYLRSTIATIRILNVYYYKVLKYSVVCLFSKKKIENGTKFDTDIVLIKMSE